MLAGSTSDSTTAVPVITHTAATPQDSPSTTLEPGASFRDFNLALSLEHSSMLSSLDSIDRTSVSVWLTGRILLLNLFFSCNLINIILQCTSIPGLLKPPNSYTLTLHSAVAQLAGEKARLPPMSLAPPQMSLMPPPLRTPSPVPTSSSTPRSMPSPLLPEKNLQISFAKDDNCLSTNDKSSLLSSQK